MLVISRTQEMEARGSRVRGYPLLESKLVRASQGQVRLHLPFPPYPPNHKINKYESVQKKKKKPTGQKFLLLLPIYSTKYKMELRAFIKVGKTPK